MKPWIVTAALLCVTLLSFSQEASTGAKDELSQDTKIALMKAVLADSLWREYERVYNHHDRALALSMGVARKEAFSLSFKDQPKYKDLETRLRQSGIVNAADLLRLQAKLSVLSREISMYYPQLSRVRIDDWIKFFRQCN